MRPATTLALGILLALPVAAARGDPRMLLIRGKGGKERMVPLSPPARAALAAWLKLRDAAEDEKKKSGAENYEPTVTVSTHKEGEKLKIKVTDNGNGIPEKVLDKIFQPFFSTKQKGEGTGLGLAVVHGIIQNHKGEINIISECTEEDLAKIELRTPNYLSFFQVIRTLPIEVNASLSKSSTSKQVKARKASDVIIYCIFCSVSVKSRHVSFICLPQRLCN